jgi:flagellar basal body rod protein FlgC
VNEFDVLSTAADGMSMQRAMLDVAARNVAAAQASTPAHPYARLVAQFASRSPEDAFAPDAGDDGIASDRSGDVFAPERSADAFAPDRTADAFAPNSGAGAFGLDRSDDGGDGLGSGLTAASGSSDPGSDEGGVQFVGSKPGGEGADALTEMIAVLEAQRAYEANASVFDVGKRLAERTLDVGR